MDTDPVWDAFVDLALRLGATQERRSRYGDKPALCLGSREIAHSESPGLLDLRITHGGWTRVRDRFGDDPAVTKTSARRDWLELRLDSAAQLDRFRPLVQAMVEANRQ